ncbi:tRNA (5-methylaminomethyl-2-thiouridine)(34)-methyltransferase MnmD [Aestuariivivens marinum]|uniref:tRNA (5-methylaminomethyl-2-thiouridine)(34)-methyltransferase MnmD n=1 Tax=Aestuariivivens marinum TaxID=2913555 RepID=UPI001F58F27B|nr:tRNA (5-methylaminomethyl-2-thiouridine)(34)-methyltransferase MnmD [Aestuariivivens marinum]
MKRKIILTSDGSTTIHLPEWNEQYHSKHGAIQEAYHVFIKHGLHYYCHSVTERSGQEFESSNSEIAILEMGFGTGLNAFITLLESKKLKVKIDYIGIEAFPVTIDEVLNLNYPKALNMKGGDAIFKGLHSISWEERHNIDSFFSLAKQKKYFETIDDEDKFNIIYFDAFGARVQPGLWTKVIFKKMYDALKVNGILVTYSAKGSVRRAMQDVGFKVEKLPGPPGKREMLRAVKY